MDLSYRGRVTRGHKHADGFTVVLPQSTNYEMTKNIGDIPRYVGQPPRRETIPRELPETAGGTPVPHDRVRVVNRRAIKV
jgi:hypothetical protein